MVGAIFCLEGSVLDICLRCWKYLGTLKWEERVIRVHDAHVQGLVARPLSRILKDVCRIAIDRYVVLEAMQHVDDYRFL